MFILPEDVIKILLAVLVGGGIGLERELHNKAAGFRTISLICIGATLFTIISIKFGGDRIASTIVSGVGFLGAGVIMRADGRVKGLTTASTIWVASALGMAIGSGHYTMAMLTGLAVIIVLWVFGRLDKWIDLNGSEARTYEMSCLLDEAKIDQLTHLFKQHGVYISRCNRFKQNDLMILHWETHARLKNHDFVAAKLFADPDLKELRF